MKEWKNLFPNNGALITFVLYILLFVFQGVFVTASKRKDAKYDYNITLVVFMSELTKLIISSILYTTRRENKPHLIKAISLNIKLLMLYFTPSLLYCFYNNLAFENLLHYDPTTYYILLQFRVVITAIIFQCLFNKKLSLKQWLSLSILTAGCIMKNFDTATFQNNSDSDIWSQVFNVYFLSINFQTFCSCLAGTYNEYLLKTQGENVDIFLQNVFMYLDSVVCNFFMLMFKGQLGTVFQDFSPLGNVLVLLIIINSAIVGIVTSFFLKYLNSILKTYASALELIISAVVCYFLFGIVVTWYTVISICLVIVAVMMYFKNPVNNNVDSSSLDSLDKTTLLDNISVK